jgi:hypothetical protein
MTGIAEFGVDDVVVGVVRADLEFELVIEREGLKKYRG